MSYKCSVCYLILDDESVVDGLCPYCSTQVTKMCENDHVCTCSESIHQGTFRCPVCNEFVCACGAHGDSMILSRITGYIQPVYANGHPSWNMGKVAEFHSRSRYNPITGGMYSSVDGTPKEYK